MNKCAYCDTKYFKTYQTNLPNRFETFLYPYEMGKYNCEICALENKATHNVQVKRKTTCKKTKKEHITFLSVYCCKTCKENILLHNDVISGNNYYNIMQRLVDPSYDSESDISDVDIDEDEYDYEMNDEIFSDGYDEEYSGSE